MSRAFLCSWRNLCLALACKHLVDRLLVSVAAAMNRPGWHVYSEADSTSGISKVT